MRRIVGLLLIVIVTSAGAACSLSRVPQEARESDHQCNRGLEGRSDNAPDWFYPESVASAQYNRALVVLDTDSPFGSRSLKTKEIGLKDLARIHGHLCDGLVIGFVQIESVLEMLFPSGVVDRTDLTAVSKNGACWVDAVAFMTGARVNFETLRIDDSVGDGFILHRISTGETYAVHLKPGVFPEAQAALEKKLRGLRGQGRSVSADDVEALEQMANALSRKMLNTPPSDLLDIRRLAPVRQ
jgi:formylmethanofuran dehydrogenase subunit E